MNTKEDQDTTFASKAKQIKTQLSIELKALGVDSKDDRFGGINAKKEGEVLSISASPIKISYEFPSKSAPRWRDGMRRKTLSPKGVDASFDLKKIAAEIVQSLDYLIVRHKERQESSARQEEVVKEETRQARIAEKELPDPQCVFSKIKRRVTGEYAIELNRTVSLSTAIAIQNLLLENTH